MEICERVQNEFGPLGPLWLWIPPTRPPERPPNAAPDGSGLSRAAMAALGTVRKVLGVPG
jgi:hypothetical protein